MAQHHILLGFSLASAKYTVKPAELKLKPSRSLSLLAAFCRLVQPRLSIFKLRVEWISLRICQPTISITAPLLVLGQENVEGIYWSSERPRVI